MPSLLLLLFTCVGASLTPLREFTVTIQDYVVSRDYGDIVVELFKCTIVPYFGVRNMLLLGQLGVLRLGQSGSSKVRVDLSTSLMPWVMRNKHIFDVFHIFVRQGDNLNRTTDMTRHLQVTYNTLLCELLESRGFRRYYRDALIGDKRLLLGLTDLLVRYYYCMLDVDTGLNCPGPCATKKNPCDDVEFSDGACVPYLPDSASFRLDLESLEPGGGRRRMALRNISEWLLRIPKERRLPLALFKRADEFELKNTVRLLYRLQFHLAQEASCNCKFGFAFDRGIRRCYDRREELLCGGGNPCRNGGLCRRRRLRNGTATNQVLCQCPPAFSGQFCHRQRNPCLFRRSDTTCGRYPCLRDRTSPFGFRCRCPATLRRQGPHNPRCVDLDECKELRPCRHGGSCLNLVGDFRCACALGFQGRRCEVPPPPPLWAEWGPWGTCVKPERARVCEELPFQMQTRECQVNILQQRCLGPRRRLRYFCPGESELDRAAVCGEARRPPIDAAALGEPLEYVDPDDRGVSESDPPVETRGVDFLPTFMDTIYFTAWFALLLTQVFVVWTLSSVLTNFLWYLSE